MGPVPLGLVIDYSLARIVTGEGPSRVPCRRKPDSIIGLVSWGGVRESTRGANWEPRGRRPRRARRGAPPLRPGPPGVRGRPRRAGERPLGRDRGRRPCPLPLQPYGDLLRPGVRR